MAVVDLFGKRRAVLRPRAVRTAQRTAYRPGSVMRVDWAEMPTRQRSGGHYALICTLRSRGLDGAVELRHDNRDVPTSAA